MCHPRLALYDQRESEYIATSMQAKHFEPHTIAEIEDSAGSAVVQDVDTGGDRHDLVAGENLGKK